MADAEKKCPKCHEKVKLLASRCKHCGHEFTSDEMADARKIQRSTSGCAVVLVLGLVIGLLAMCTGGDKTATPAKSAAVVAEEHRKGFHCLSAWDGSNRSLVRQIKAGLRDPDSFEEIETKITPVRSGGVHTASMSYRARNGFGGMNVTTALATIDPVSCEATVISSGE